MIRYCTQPAAPLAPLIAQFWSITAAAGTRLPDYLPGTGTEILLNVADDAALLQSAAGHSADPVRTLLRSGEAVCICPRFSRLTIQTTGETRLFSIRFRSAGFFSLFAIPQQHICDQVISTEALGISLPDLPSDLSHDSLAEQLQNWLYLHYPVVDNHQSLLNHAVDQLYYQHHRLSVQTIQQATALSERGFQRHVKHITGVSAKYFARTARFQATLKRLLASGQPSSLDTLLTQGYYDQSHFIRDFRHFTGTTPARYLTDHQRRCNFYLPTTAAEL